MPIRTSRFAAVVTPLALLLSLLVMTTLIGVCRAQTPPQESAPPPKENPGLLNELGKLLKPPSLLPESKTPRHSADDPNVPAKEAPAGLSRLLRSPIVYGRIACPLAENGAPNCKAASDKLCQAKGFESGKSLATDSTRTCSAKALLAGGSEKGGCRASYFVTSAFCQ